MIVRGQCNANESFIKQKCIQRAAAILETLFFDQFWMIQVNTVDEKYKMKYILG